MGCAAVDPSAGRTSLTLHSSDIGVVLGSYWNNGKENGNYYVIMGYILGS